MAETVLLVNTKQSKYYTTKEVHSLSLSLSYQTISAGGVTVLFYIPQSEHMSVLSLLFALLPNMKAFVYVFLH